MARNKSLSQRLGFKGPGSCRVTLYNSDPGFETGGPVGSGMTLREMLALDEQLLAGNDAEVGSGQTPTRIRPNRVPVTVSPSSMLFEETFREDELSENGEVGPTWNDSVCCVCMGSKKRSALIPRGHTFCRVCSRKLTFDRGTCPLCNHRITSYLDLF